jgi:hypothetical protein
MTRHAPLIAVVLLALATGAAEASEQRVRAPQASAQTPQALNAADGHGHRQSGPEACRQAAISTLRAWGNPVESLAMAMIEGGADAWLVRIDDLTRPDPWRAAVSLGVCTARQEDGFWRIEAFSLRPANDPAADCAAAMAEAGRSLQVAQVRIDGTLQGRDGRPAEIAATLLDAQGRPVASGACPLVATPEGAFMIAPGRIEASRR